MDEKVGLIPRCPACQSNCTAGRSAAKQGSGLALRLIPFIEKKGDLRVSFVIEYFNTLIFAERKNCFFQVINHLFGNFFRLFTLDLLQHIKGFNPVFE